LYWDKKNLGTKCLKEEEEASRGLTEAKPRGFLCRLVRGSTDKLEHVFLVSEGGEVRYWSEGEVSWGVKNREIKDLVEKGKGVLRNFDKGGKRRSQGAIGFRLISNRAKVNSRVKRREIEE